MKHNPRSVQCSKIPAVLIDERGVYVPWVRFRCILIRLHHRKRSAWDTSCFVRWQWRNGRREGRGGEGGLRSVGAEVWYAHTADLNVRFTLQFMFPCKRWRLLWLIQQKTVEERSYFAQPPAKRNTNTSSPYSAGVTFSPTLNGWDYYSERR